MKNRLPSSIYVPPHQRLPLSQSPIRYISAYDDRLSEEPCHPDHSVAIHSANLEDWTRTFSMLLGDSVKQEVLSREKKDRRDFDQLKVLATSLGLYSHAYAKVVVFSKIPLPNY
ncbi:hypothetical protein AALP_AA5G000900, partial [Arabis alpina]